MRNLQAPRLGMILSAIFALSLPQSAFAATKMEGLVAQKTGTIERLHFKAKKALVTAAQDKTFDSYFQSHSEAGRSEIKPRIDQISLAVQSRFHVEEMCLINPKGAELSRIVGREIADDLADDETAAIFFAPGFAKPARKVHVSPIYMSVDANKWVIAYVTPVVVNGDKKAILHYEHTLKAFQNALNNRVDADTAIVAIDANGFIVSDSRKTIAVGKKDQSDDPASYFDRFKLSGLDLDNLRKAVDGTELKGAGTVIAGGTSYSLAYSKVEDWTILAFKSN